VRPYTRAGDYGLLWVAIGLGCRRPARVAATVWGTLGVNYAVKQAVGRERPADLDADPLVPPPASSSFPKNGSGRASFST